MPGPPHIAMFAVVIRADIQLFLHNIECFGTAKKSFPRLIMKIISVEGIRIPLFSVSAIPFLLVIVRKDQGTFPVHSEMTEVP